MSAFLPAFPTTTGSQQFLVVSSLALASLVATAVGLDVVPTWLLGWRLDDGVDLLRLLGLDRVELGLDRVDVAGRRELRQTLSQSGCTLHQLQQALRVLRVQGAKLLHEDDPVCPEVLVAVSVLDDGVVGGPHPTDMRIRHP